MAEAFSIKINTSGDSAELLISGQIDEDAQFVLDQSINQNTIIFNFENVIHINSCGIREWIKFQNGLGENKKYIYKNCPQIIVEQMNIVKGFIRPGGMIESFYAPYYLESADEERKILVTPNQVINGKAPKIVEKGEELEFDDIEAQYFNFLKNS